MTTFVTQADDFSGAVRRTAPCCAYVSMDDALNRMSAGRLVAGLSRGEITASDLVEACLDRIAAREPDVKAWAFLDAERARERARLADAWRASGQLLGPLHGLPVGVKDVFDTADMPSEYGSATLRGRQPTKDADAVAMLRRAGAIVLGKTATSEFGMYHPSPTRNPLDLSRTPGVSSSGSTAAVVDHMVPLGLGTQHTASTTLPASFCGAFAFKPSLGFTSMAGSNVLVPRLAQLGLLARSVSDLCLFAGVFNPGLAESHPVVRAPRLGFVKGPGWTTTDADARDAIETLIGALPATVVPVDLPVEFDDALDITMGLLNAHLAYRFGTAPDATLQRYCPPLRDGIEAGHKISAERYLALDAHADRLVELAGRLFDDIDAIVTLSAPGEAPLLQDGPGAGVMSMPWSLCGLPTVSLPLLTGGHGLPIGVQLIGCHLCDAPLLRVAGWLEAAAENRTAAVKP
jgi:Asp-tRNA(Asn)/Glu-tRNA(Gln) amidotransferase A subunit family amidase